jgi:hypothetical protein
VYKRWRCISHQHKVALHAAVPRYQVAELGERGFAFGIAGQAKPDSGGRAHVRQVTWRG